MKSVFELTLADLMTPGILTAPLELSLGDAVQRMAGARVSSLLVVDAAQKPLGIVTQRDLLQHYRQNNTPPALANIMGRPLLVAEPSTNICSAYALMRHRGVRHLVVQSQETLCGIVSETDFRAHIGLEAFCKIRSLHNVIDWGKRRFHPDNTLAEALDYMLAEHLDYVLVVEHGRALGVISERELPDLWLNHTAAEQTKLGQVVRPSVSMLLENSVVEAAALMQQHRCAHVVALDADGMAVGVVSQHHLLEQLNLGTIGDAWPHYHALHDENTHLKTQLRTILEAAELGVWEYDHRNDTQYWSPTLLAALGYTIEQTPIGIQGWLDRIHPDDRPHLEAKIASALAPHNPLYRAEYRLLGGDEKWHWVRALGRVVERDLSGYPLKTVGVMADIAEERALHTELESNRTLLDAILEATADGILVVSVDGRRVLKTNQRFQHLWHLPDDLLAQGCAVALLRAALDQLQNPGRFVADIQRLRQAEGDVRAQVQFRDGRVLEYEGRLLTTEGVVSARVWSFRDITDRARAEAALREREQIYRAIVTQTPDSVVLIDADTLHFVEFNDPACQALGYSREEFADLSIPDIQAELSEPEVRNKIRQILQTGWAEFETRHRRRDGHVCDVLVNNRVVSLGDHVYLAATWRDITERKKAQVERERLHTQLQQAQKMEAIGQLTGGIAHDFNNMLAAIMGYTGLALERCVDDKQSRLAGYLNEVMTAGERARDLISKMLAFSRGVKATLAPLDVAPLVSEVAKTLRSVLPSSIVLSVHIDAQLPRIRSDFVQLHQVLVNLVINARDSIGEQGHIHIYLRRTHCVSVCSSCHQGLNGEYLELAVQDDGHGIAPEIQHRIFDPFFTTKEVGKGTGMGLPMVHGIVHEHGGHVRVETQPSGTTMRLLFPCLADQSDDAEACKVMATDAAVPIARSYRLMIVDDERVLGEMLGEMLEGQGYQVDVYTDSLQAAAAFAATPAQWDAVVTDQTMPGLSGVELAQRLLQQRADLPIILCSGYSDRINADNAAQLGIAQFFLKPLALNDLLNALRRYLKPLV